MGPVQRGRMRATCLGSALIRRVFVLRGLVLATMALSAACTGGPQAQVPEQAETSLSVSSAAFGEGQSIPSKHTCDGENLSPPLGWTEPPSGTQAFALVMEDLDTPQKAFTHWVVFNLPAESRALPEGVSSDSTLPTGASHGNNQLEKAAYFGPCPSMGPPHRYRFTLYALDSPLDLETGASKAQLMEAMDGHVLAEAQVTGLYQG